MLLKAEFIKNKKTPITPLSRDNPLYFTFIVDLWYNKIHK